jgi:hypothetical protein
MWSESVCDHCWFWSHYVIYHSGTWILSSMIPLMSQKRNPKFKCGLLLLIPTLSVDTHTYFVKTHVWSITCTNTFFEISFRGCFGEID